MPPVQAEPDLIYRANMVKKMEQREIEKAYSRLFASEDGQKVLAHLQVLTFHRALGPTTSDEQLRYIEGQRSLVATILRLVDRGRKAA